MYFEPGMVEHMCEKCSCEQASMSYRIKSVPRILLIHLKRFQVNPDTMSYEKINLPIQINRSLHLGFPHFQYLSSTSPLS